MPQRPDDIPIPCDREAYRRYLHELWLLLGLLAYGMGWIVYLAFNFIWRKMRGISWPEETVSNYACFIQDGRLHIQSGILFRSEKMIPLGKITHVTRVQGPLLRRHGIQCLHVHTASMGLSKPEAVIIAPCDPDATERLILSSLRPPSGTPAGVQS